VDTGRLEAFSDGVFAIAITLLILDVHEGAEGSLARQLAHAWPSYIGYAISFLTIGIMWANHHSIFRLIDRTSHGLIVANLLLLLCVSFVPFPTRVLADHRRAAGPDQRTATLLFTATFVGIAAFYNLLWQTAARGNRLIVPGLEAEAALVTRRYRYGEPGYLLSLVLSFVSVPAALAVVGALDVLFLLPRGAPENSSVREV